VIQRVDLGPCPAYVYEGDGPTAIAMPGAMLAGMPALWFAFEPLVELGWRIVLPWYELLDRTVDRWEFVRTRFEAAGPCDVVIAKSLGNYAAPFDVPAVCLTPALVDPELVEALRASAGELLLVGGTDDELWDGAVARELGEVLELEGADHGLARTHDAPRIAAAVLGALRRA
jgi:hypothetical protein